MFFPIQIRQSSQLLIGTLLLTATLLGCQHESAETATPAMPTGYDVLARAQGHWQWEYTSGFRFQQTPATTGFTRHLVFGPDSTLTIYRNSVPLLQTPYQLSQGTFRYCGSAQQLPRPLVSYTAEPNDLNNGVKGYTISTEADGSRTLALVGEGACTDAGTYERYRWVGEVGAR